MEVRKGHRARIPFLAGQFGHIDGMGTWDPKDGDTHRSGRAYGAMSSGEFQDSLSVNDDTLFDRWSGIGLLLAGIGMENHIELSLRLPVPSGKDVLYRLVTAGQALDPSTEPQCPLLKSVASSVMSATKWVENHFSGPNSKDKTSSTGSAVSDAN